MDGLSLEDASVLIRSLSHHPLLGNQDLTEARKAITFLKFSETSREYIVFPENSQTIQESTESYHSFSLRRLLKNRALQSRPSFSKQAYAAVISSFGFYSSNVMTRRAKANEDIAEIIRNACRRGDTYSLLGKLETFESDGEDGKGLIITTRPILIVPHATKQEIQEVSQWEAANSLYEKEARIFGFFPYRRELKTSA